MLVDEADEVTITISTLHSTQSRDFFSFEFNLKLMNLEKNCSQRPFIKRLLRP